MVWIIGAGLVLLLVAVSIAASALKGKKPAPKGARALIVPTADRARTVVVPPCNTGEPVTGATAASQVRTLGATAVQLPRGSGTRVVMIPRCTAGAGTTANPGANLPSAAFVLRIGARVPPDRTGALGGFRSQLIVPTGSQASTIVVPPCTGEGASGRRAVVLAPRAGQSHTALAPSC